MWEDFREARITVGKKTKADKEKFKVHLSHKNSWGLEVCHLWETR